MVNTPAAPDGVASQSFRELARIDKLQMLYGQSAHGVVAAAVSAVLWARIVWPHAEPDRVVAWSVCVGITSLFRLALFVGYLLRKPQGRAVLAWELPYTVTLLLSATVWGVGCVLAMPRESLLHETITFFVLVAMSGAALPAYGVLLRATQALVVIMLAPMIGVLLLRGDSTSTYLAVAGIWFFLTVMRATQKNSTAVERSLLLTHELRAATRIAEVQAQTDPLTALNNRRAFTRVAESLVSAAREVGNPVALLLIDVDRFKEINDAHGHAAGDSVLRAVAETLLAHTRHSDVCGRLGGDEFAVLLVNTGLEDAIHVADTMRAALQAHPTHGAAGPLGVTLSIGVTAAPEQLESMLGHADRAMYEAKRAGRDRVACRD